MKWFKLYTSFICARARDSLLYPSLLFILYFNLISLSVRNGRFFCLLFAKKSLNENVSFPVRVAAHREPGDGQRAENRAFLQGFLSQIGGEDLCNRQTAWALFPPLCNKGCYSLKRRSIYEGKKMEHTDPFLPIAAKLVHGLQR